MAERKTGRERVREILAAHIQLMTLETLSDAPGISDVRDECTDHRAAIASDLDALAAAREAAGPVRRFAEARRYMPNATRSVPTDAEFWALLDALDGKREGGT